MYFPIFAPIYSYGNKQLTTLKYNKIHFDISFSDAPFIEMLYY